MDTRLLLAGAISLAMAVLPPAVSHAVTNIRLEPVAGLGTGTPYPSAALSADPALVNYRTYDLKIHLEERERFAVGVMFTSLDGTHYSALPGTFYAPSNVFSITDRDTPQINAYDASSRLNFKYDSWLNGLASTADAFGDYWTDTPFDETSTNLANGAPNLPIFPRTSSNPRAQAAADLARNAISTEWFDLDEGSDAYPVPGDYTIARLTFDAGVGGGFLGGEVDTNRFDAPFLLQLPAVPEPVGASVLVIGMSLGISRRARFGRSTRS